MDLQIRSVRDGSTVASEVVVLQVVKTCNIGDYLIMDNTFSPSGGTSNLWKHTYRFPQIKLEAGTWIFLYTKPGLDKPTITDNGNYAYRLHMGLDSAVWNNAGDKATLVKIASFITVDVN